LSNKSTFYLDLDYVNFGRDKTRLKFDTLSDVSTGEVIFMAVVAFVLIGLGVFNLIFAINRDNRYRAEGQPTTLTVTDCRMVKRGTKGASRVPQVSYTYEADGTFTGSDKPDGNCNDYPVGSTLNGMYLRTNRGLSRIVTPEQLAQPFLQRHTTPLTTFFVTGLMSLLPIHSVWKYLRAWQRYPRLRDKGRLLPGYVVRAETRMRYKSMRHFIYITYTFVTPDGTRLERKQSKQREDMLSKRLPLSGAPVKILYADDNAHVML
jgi:hypothetical protein